MTKEKAYKWPRVYVQDQLIQDHTIALDKDLSHYLRHVMRRKEGDPVRVFNGQDGEWQTSVIFPDKKHVHLSCIELLRDQPESNKRIHFYFAPIKQARMDWMIEKAVELGATDFHPVITQNTEVRKLKYDRIRKQLTEAAEQSEQMALAQLYEAQSLHQILDGWDEKTELYACIERFDATPIQNIDLPTDDFSFLIGPVGGFTDDEKRLMDQCEFISAINLGEQVLRCETAACYVLSATKLHIT